MKKLVLILILLCVTTLLAAEDGEIIRMSFEGNVYFSDATLRSSMGIRSGQYSSTRLLERAEERLLEVYQANGFDEAAMTIHSEPRYGLRGGEIVYVEVDEGTPTIVESVAIEHNNILADTIVSDAVGFLTDDVWTLVYSDRVQMRLVQLFTEHGYLYVEVDVETELVGKTARLSVIVDEGQRVKISHVELTGYGSIIERVIRREIVIEDGQWFSPKDIADSQRNIHSTGLFQGISYIIVGKSEKQLEVAIRFELEPDKTKWFGLGVGYESPDMVFIEPSWGNDNLMGKLQQLELKAGFFYGFTNGEFLQYYDVTYREPWLLSVRGLTGQLHPYFYNFNFVFFGLEQFGGEVSLAQKFSPEISANIGFKLERSNLWIKVDGYVYDNDDMGLIDQEGFSNTSALFSGFTFDSRNEPFNPSRGFHCRSSLEYAGGFLGGHHDYYKATLDLSGYTALGDGLILGLHGFGAYAEVHHDTTTVPIYERFFVGGAYSLRGFRERSVGPLDGTLNPLGGRVAFTANAELRVQVAESDLWLGFFADTGMAWPNLEETSLSDLAIGAGFGIRYLTPIGPVRLDIGFVIDPGRPVIGTDDEGNTPEYDPSAWNLHLALGNLF